MKKNLIILSALLFSLSSCEFKCNVGKMEKVSESDSSGSNNSGTTGSYNNGVNTSQVLNDINLTATGDVKVYRAFLSDGTNPKKENTTAMGVPIFLNLNIENGWHEENGKVFLGAEQSVTTDNGTKVLKSEDLFASYDESGVSADDSKFVTMKAVVNNASGPIEYYIVNFRVWDKKGNSEIKGSYKFKTTEASQQ